MKIKNVGEIISQLKPLLPQYLMDQGYLRNASSGTNFKCPNFENHDKSSDNHASCGFLPDSDHEKAHCFSCKAVFDIFRAMQLIEDRDISGINFYKVVRELADRYDVKYGLEEPTEAEKNFETSQQFLLKIVQQGHSYLKNKKPKEVYDYLRSRGWDVVIDKFKLGYLPAGEPLKKFFLQSFAKKPILKSLIRISDEQLADRIIIPILSSNGTILGLNNRTFRQDDSRQKYQKHFLKSLKSGSVLFNSSRKFDRVYVVEGGSSVLTLVSSGIENVVAINGSTFHPEMYEKLVQSDVESIVFCFDGDTAGETCLEKAIAVVQDKPDIKIYVKMLPDNTDPAEIVLRDGVDTFKKIPEVSLFKHQLDKLKEDEENKDLKECLYHLIISIPDDITREKMIKMFVKEMDTQKTALIHELKKFETLNTSSADISVTDVMEEKESFRKKVESFEENAWRVDGMLGVETKFPKFDLVMDGLQDGLHEVGGMWNVGKSAWMISMALNLIKNPEYHVIYFSIDDPALKVTIPRFVANLSGIPINSVADPYHKIQLNETLTNETKADLLGRREKAVNRLLYEFSDRLEVKDSSDGDKVSYVEKVIKLRKMLAHGKKLIVFVDFLHMLTDGSFEGTELLTRVSRALKRFSGLYNIPIVTTVEATKDISTCREMKSGHIKGSVSLQYGADTILLMGSDFYDNEKSDMYFRDPETGEAKPIVKMNVGKNKISGFRGNLYFKFWPEFSKFQEVSEEEYEKYKTKF